MAMVKITNGEVTNIVSRGAFNGTYKKLGFWVVGDDEPVKKVQPVAKVDEIPEPVAPKAEPDEDTDTEFDDDFEELLEKPISQWTKQEVKDFATAKGIDIKGTKNANEAKEIIKKYLDDEAKNAAEA